MTRRNKLEEEQRKRVDETKAIEATADEWRSEGLSTRRRRKFDDKRKTAFLQHFALTDRLCESAAVAGVTIGAVRSACKEDKEFAEAFEDARYSYRDIIQRQVTKLAVEGVDEPFIAGRDEDKQPIIMTRKKYATDVLILEAKRTNPEHRDKQDVNVNVRTAGNLAVPLPLTEAEWDAQFAKKTPDSGKD